MKIWKAELMLLLMTLVWGATFLFTKIGLELISPILYVILRFSVALVLIVLFYRSSLFQIDKTMLWKGLSLGLIFGLGFILQTKGLEYTKIQKSAFITGLTVAITPFTFKLITGKTIKLFSWIGVLIATIGLYLFTNPAMGNFNLGDAYTILSTFCWAFFLTLLDKFTKGISDFSFTIKLVFLQIIGTLAVSILGYLSFEARPIPFEVFLSPDLWISLAFNGILASFILMIIHTKYQHYTTPVKAALIFSLEPVFASIIALIFTNEVLNNREMIGAIVLFAGVLTSELGGYLFSKFK